MKKKKPSKRSSALTTPGVSLLGRSSLEEIEEELAPCLNARVLVRGLQWICTRFGYPAYAFVFMGTARHASRVSRISEENKDCLEELSNIFFTLSELLDEGAFSDFPISPSDVNAVISMLSGNGPIKEVSATEPYQLGVRAAAEFATQYGAEKLYLLLFYANVLILSKDSPVSLSYKAMSAAVAEMMNELAEHCFPEAAPAPMSIFGGKIPMGSAN